MTQSTGERLMEWETVFEDRKFVKLSLACGRGKALGFRVDFELLSDKSAHLTGDTRLL